MIDNTMKPVLEQKDGYWVDPKGRIWSEKSNKYLKPCYNKWGYAYVDLCNNKCKLRVFIHQIVAKCLFLTQITFRRLTIKTRIKRIILWIIWNGALLLITIVTEVYPTKQPKDVVNPFYVLKRVLATSLREKRLDIQVVVVKAYCMFVTVNFTLLMVIIGNL